jgi:hypothetical protein
MRKLLSIILLSFALVMPSVVVGQHHRGHHSSKKSHTAGSHDGTYQGGTGSSHKGGHYKNKKTGDHYRDRKDGTPK